MEITEKNHGRVMGFEDYKNAIFIDESNYTKRFKEFLDSPNDPKWEMIAREGRKYVLENMSNDNGVDILRDIMRDVLGEKSSNTRHGK